MKIVWHSNAPHAPSGYGQQTALFTPMMRDAGHDVALSANWGVAGAATEWRGMKVYPADSDWGNEMLPIVATMHGDGDPSRVQVITLMDVWVLHSKLLSALNVASWVPVDHQPVPPLVAAYFKRTGAVPIAMSRFGEARLREVGLDPLYVPHGVDLDALTPGGGDVFRAQAGIPEDAFVVGMVAANQGAAPARKAFPAAFWAFAAFRAEHPEAILYLHTTLNTSGGLDIPHWLKLCGVPEEAVRVTGQSDLFVGIDRPEMARMYAGFDVLLNPAYGEGFGVPVLEAQASGTPVIVNDFSAMPELCGAGWRVSGLPVVHEAQGSWWHAPDVGSIVAMLCEAYEAKAVGAMGELRAAAREFAEGYGADRVYQDYWVPVLDQLERALDAKPVAAAKLVAKPLPQEIAA